jgi:hypothetical protein
MAKLGHIAIDGDGFYEVKYFDPDGVAFDLTGNGWKGALKE